MFSSNSTNDKGIKIGGGGNDHSVSFWKRMKNGSGKTSPSLSTSSSSISTLSGNGNHNTGCGNPNCQTVGCSGSNGIARTGNYSLVVGGAADRFAGVLGLEIVAVKEGENGSSYCSAMANKNGGGQIEGDGGGGGKGGLGEGKENGDGEKKNESLHSVWRGEGDCGMSAAQVSFLFLSLFFLSLFFYIYIFFCFPNNLSIFADLFRYKFNHFSLFLFF